MNENFNPKETNYDFQNWSFKQISGMLRYNSDISDETFLIKEIESRRRELNAEEEIIVAVRNQIGRLFSGEIEIKDIQDIDRVEDEIAQQFPKVNQSRYKGMVAETILAVLQEWKFRNTKNIYTEEDEENLSSLEKKKLSGIIFRQHVRTGITGKALSSYKPKSNVSVLLMKIEEESSHLTLGNIYGVYKEGSDFKKERFDDTEIPEDIPSLIKIIQDSKKSDKVRTDAGNKIVSMFREAVNILDKRWLADFEVYVKRAFRMASSESVENKWEKLCTNLDGLVSELESGTKLEEGIKLTEDFVEKYRQFVKKNPKYTGLVNAILAGCKRYALNKQMLEHASEKAKRIYLAEMQDILNFEILGVWLKDLISSFEKSNEKGANQERSNPEAGFHQQSERKARVRRSDEYQPNGSKIDELPEETEEQRKFLMDKVRRLENRNVLFVPITGLSIPSEQVRREFYEIIDYLNDPNCNKEIAREIFARLRLYHCSQIMNAVNFSRNPSEVVRASLSGESRRFLLDESLDQETFIDSEGRKKTDTEVIFSISGVSEAFLALQRAEVEGYEYQGNFIQLGTVANRDQKEHIDRQLLREIENKGFNTETAKEALRLARMYYFATGEYFIRDYDFKRAPSLSRLVYFAEWRNSRFSDDRGPMSTLYNIESLGLTSYLRSCKTNRNMSKDGVSVPQYLFLPDEENNIDLLAILYGFNPFSIDREFFNKGSYINQKGEKVFSYQPYPKAREAFLRRNWGVELETGEAVYVDLSKLSLSEIKEGEYASFLGRIASAHELAEILLRSDFNPEDLNLDKIAQARFLVTKIDPTGFLNLGFWLTYGIWKYYIQHPGKWQSDKDATVFYTSLMDRVNGLVSKRQLEAMGAGYLRFLISRLENRLRRSLEIVWPQG